MMNARKQIWTLMQTNVYCPPPAVAHGRLARGLLGLEARAISQEQIVVVGWPGLAGAG